MASLNKVILIGNLTKDPELKQTPSGTSVVSFSIGVSRKYSGTDGSRETDFINVVAWKGTAEFIAKYFRKGNGISIVSASQKLRKQRSEALCDRSRCGRSRIYRQKGKHRRSGWLRHHIAKARRNIQRFRIAVLNFEKDIDKEQRLW